MDTTHDITLLLEACIKDMKHIAETGSISLDAQVRAYDLMSSLDDGNADLGTGIDSSKTALFPKIYNDLKIKIDSAFDNDALTAAAKARLAPLERACTDARLDAEAATSLHEAAKRTFGIWQDGGIIRRYTALRALRRQAGFRLESHRIGNYVAKTFDLMNEAKMNFARAQQKLFANDVTYKIKPGIYGLIAGILH